MEGEEFRLCNDVRDNQILSQGKLPSGVRKIVSRDKIIPARVLDFNEPDETSGDSKATTLKNSDEISDLVSDSNNITACSEYSAINKMMALLCLQERKELDAIDHLVKSHAVFLQASVYHRCKKTEKRNQFYLSQEYGLKTDHMRDGRPLKTKLADLPQEWYTIQLTVQYEPPKLASPDGPRINSMDPVHITVLPTGPDAIDPICITLPRRATVGYDAVHEVVEIVKNNKNDLQATYGANSQYWAMRAKQNSRMQVAMKVVENDWLREWRILLIADPVEDSPLVTEMRTVIDKLIADDLTTFDISSRARWLLKKIATCACYLTKLEIARAVHHVIGHHEKLSSNIIFSIHGKLKNIDPLREVKRKSLILIVDESLDHLPFESMTILTNHPVTRFPSFHVAYAMFKEHENTIVNGCKIVNMNDKCGTFIVNPGRDLPRTEKRMRLFIDYWLPEWKGMYNTTPDEKNFGDVLVNHDILMYVGHGSGIQYMPGNQIEKLRVRALPLLFGCSSVKLSSSGGRFPPTGVSNRYITAASPCVLGALWEITDGDVDKLTARFISEWIPSKAKRPWLDVDQTKWVDGSFTFKTPSPDEQPSPAAINEPEMLRAIAKSKQSCAQHMTAAAIIVRGLPTRLV